jgi:hypothetical protein
MDTTKQIETILAVADQLRKEGFTVECDAKRAGRMKIGYVSRIYSISYLWHSLSGSRCELQINGSRGSNYSKKLRFRPVFDDKKKPDIIKLADKFRQVADSMWKSDVRKENEEKAQHELSKRLDVFDFVAGVKITNDSDTVFIEFRDLRALRPVIDYLIDNDVEWCRGTGLAFVDLELDADSTHLEPILKLLSI